jgi:hypothetical protein
MNKKMVAVAFCIVASAGAAAQTVNNIPKYTSTGTFQGSAIWEVNGNVGIGTTNPTNLLEVNGSTLLDGGGPLYLLDTNHGIKSTAGEGVTVFTYLVPNGIFLQQVTGNVGIGTTNPGAGYKLDVAGVVNASGGVNFPNGGIQTVAYTGITCGGDYAESVDVAGDRKNYEPGDVLVIGSESRSDVLKSAEPYSTLVAGIYSTKPGTVGRRQTTDAKTSTTEVPMAMVGIVPTKVSAENGSIKRGDLLVTSSTLGYAMKGTDRSKMLGAVVGKALGSLDSGMGVIEVLVTLQ